ncbi:hypothetical protein SSX86_025535 [Deinandra increscens subsp. villosa]|uniref:Calmodulin-binding domain-containing protein n=1 Tax=Deinandra increscens subsp. villosa TaxID=3103831 RepID=A0AAP0CIQ5_9ASTR
MNPTRKSSPRTFKMEPTGPKVASRYLAGPTASCHDHCKCAPKQTPETKPIPKRIPKTTTTDRTNIDPPISVPRANRSPSVTPKATTRSLKNNNIVKDQTLKKDVAIEPNKRDFKLKSANSQAKTRTFGRRLSDIPIPNKDMSLSSSRFPKRRLSEIIIHTDKDMASVSNGSTVRGSGIKNASRKDSKLPIVNKKSVSVKTTVSTTKINTKVSPLRRDKSLTKQELKETRKSKPEKPVEELVHEETLRVIEPNADVEITISRSQNQKSPDCSPSSSEVITMKDDDQDEVVESSSPSMEHDTLAKDGQDSSFEVNAMKDDQTEVVESSSPSIEDDTLVKDDQPLSSEVNATEDDENEVVEASPPSMEDDTLAKDGQPSSFEDDTLAEDDQNDQDEVVESSQPSMEDDTLAKDDQPSSFEVNATKEDQNDVVESSPPPMEDDKDDQNGVLEASPPSIEDNTPEKDDQQNDNISDSDDTKEATHVEKLEVETEDCSLDDLTFRRGTILSPESENNRLIELQFTKGKELENETEEGENITLRRLSSDSSSAVSVSESVTISVDLKHQETEEKKAAVLINNVLEEAASKLIQARKSKVKALVGAFEIVSGETPTTSDDTSGST